MVIPQPEGDLSLNIMVLGSEIINIIKKNKSKNLIVEEVMFDFLKGNKRITPENFLDALTFLYTLGLIDYKNYKIKVNRSGNS